MNILFFLTPKQDVHYIYEDFTLRQTLEKMRQRRYAAVPILKRSGEYVGTLTEGDLLWEITDKYGLDMRAAEQTLVREVSRYTVNKPVNVETDMDDLISKALNQNFVPVEDDRGISESVAAQVRHWGFEALCADDFREAMAVRRLN